MPLSAKPCPLPLPPLPNLSPVLLTPKHLPLPSNSLRAAPPRFLPSPSAAAAPPATVVRPFLDVVRSDDAGAAGASGSLAVLHKVVSLTGSTLREVIDAVASCRFEAGAQPAAEEDMLMRMLQAVVACLRVPAAAALRDQHVCTVVNTCFRVVH